MAPCILVVDDESAIRWSVAEHLRSEGYHACEAENIAQAREIVARTPIDLALLDQRLPDGNGMDLLGEFRAIQPGFPVIMVTAFSSVDNAVAAMRLGAYDYVTKPFNLDELSITVARALEASSLRTRLSDEVSEGKKRFGLANIVGNSPAINQIKNLVRKIVQSDATTVLLLGESGTGKDMVARAVHYESARADKRFINVTCSALSESLLESELFGHEKGAFTDAREQKRGPFELADGGTVFLDEIGEMPLNLQAKLLRVLEEKAFRRVGGSNDISVNVRVVASTNRDLHSAVETGEFRKDLYYRLSIVPMTLPPLRDRREDIPLLAAHFLDTYSGEFHRHFDGFSEAARRAMQAYPWPGNVRELRNVVERAALLASGPVLDITDLALGRSVTTDAPRVPEQGFALPSEGLNLFDLEKDLVRQALDYAQGNQSQACKLLGITRDQIRHRIAKYGLDANGAD